MYLSVCVYFFPSPVPCPNLYLQLNGLTFTLDTVSLLWANLFCLDLYRSLQQFKAIYKLENSGRRDEHFDARLDGFMLKVFFPFYSNLYKTKGRRKLCFSFKFNFAPYLSLCNLWKVYNVTQCYSEENEKGSWLKKKVLMYWLKRSIFYLLHLNTKPDVWKEDYVNTSFSWILLNRT